MMNDLQKAALATIIDTLRMLPWQDRKDVMRAIQYNGEFCWHCGVDDPDCQCWNDE